MLIEKSPWNRATACSPTERVRNSVDGQAIRRWEPYVRKHLYWLCRCDCGIEKPVSLLHLAGEKSRSCGCARDETRGNLSRTHGMSETRTYFRWWDMIRRCEDSRVAGYKKYGARGIRVCERWRKFENFFADMGHPPEGLTIHRINNDGDYTPENCKWATNHEQSRNTRRSKKITFNGETLNLRDWPARLGIKEQTLQSRFRYGWSVEKAFTEPVQQSAKTSPR